jgi:hypothetical protein
MSKTRKTLQPKNLAKYDVYIEDSNPKSDYFQITNLPQVFTGGRNSFLIGGSPYLRNLSNILIEVLDANGNTIYQNPVRSYLEGNSRMVSVEIYDNTPVGYCTVILLGTTTQTTDGQPVPSNWQDKYNVRWVQRVLVEPKLRNVSQLKLLDTPVAYVEEKRFYDVDTSSFSITTTPFTASLTPLLYSSFVKGYLISAVAPTTFSAEYYGATLTGSLLIDGVSASLKLPITDILNSTTAFSEGYIIQTDDNRIVDKIYLTNGNYQTNVFNSTVSITSSALLSYGRLNTISTNIPISYAKLRLVNLNTVSGEIFKAKVYSKVYTNTSTYKMISDMPAVTSEVLTTSSITGELPIGDFYLSPTASNNWYSDRLNLTSNVIYPLSGSTAYYNSSTTVIPYTLYTNDSVLLRSIYSDVPVTGSSPFTVVSNLTSSVFSTVSESGYFIGTKQPVTVFPTTEYTLQLDAYYKKYSGSYNSTGVTPLVDIYIIGVNGSTVISNDPLGQKIGRLKVNTGVETQWYQSKEFNFTPALSSGGSVGIRFVVTNGFWNFSKVSLKPAADKLFAPDEIQFLVPNTEYYNDYLQHKIEFFDINNNSTEVSIETTPTFFTGSNIDLGTLP